jgi:hypothetical protein
MHEIVGDDGFKVSDLRHPTALINSDHLYVVRSMPRGVSWNDDTKLGLGGDLPDIDRGSLIDQVRGRWPAPSGTGPW